MKSRRLICVLDLAVDDRRQSLVERIGEAHLPLADIGGDSSELRMKTIVSAWAINASMRFHQSSSA
jgi:hypothetical protein